MRLLANPTPLDCRGERLEAGFGRQVGEIVFLFAGRTPLADEPDLFAWADAACPCRRSAEAAHRPAHANGREAGFQRPLRSLAPGRRSCARAKPNNSTNTGSPGYRVLVVDTSIGGARIVRELDVLAATGGKPATIVSYNRTEMTSRAVLERTNRTGVEWHYIAPRSRTRTASSRASTDRPRDECLNERSSARSRRPHGDELAFCRAL